MTNLVKLILENKYSEAKKIINEELDNIKARELVEYKKYVNGEIGIESESDDTLDEARFKIVRVRIRKGKIQRRKKVATQKGYTFRGGKLIRMSPQERRNRRISQRRGRLKRRGKINRALRKTKRSMRRRKALGAD